MEIPLKDIEESRKVLLESLNEIQAFDDEASKLAELGTSTVKDMISKKKDITNKIKALVKIKNVKAKPAK